ncbi:putative amino acid aldolase or racemase [Belliella baltica DSM 15883]|uniref:Putative amino acid aldolase or racemase n=1 Tax=Belliella baltica (strain DSM 15883 / CIP 108006 / LMG 21964 / BA134) TaxID=866536 RepID=I3Z6D7_BELBD|nr:alanine racemase [Belliella baltica]AFL84805.1 putative amino acid aldolase or racemase [Belliella baltica DSM 15883]
MSYLSQITSPTLLIDEAICRNNLQKMANKAKKHGLKLIPHFKTGQSKAIGKWAKEYGITEITVSSIKMAKYFCQDGWENIHIAFPFNPLEIETLQELTKENKISIQLVNEEVAESLNKSLTSSIEFFIEIDAGYGRTGVEATDFGTIEKILRKAKERDKLIFKGFYIHAGHSYYEKDISKIYEETRLALNMLKTKYSSEYPNLVTRIGDTPGCSTMDDFGDIDEVGPGNFVFYDITQARIGSCQKSDIAVALAAPVVDIKKDKKTILVHAGGVHLAKDVLMESDGSKNFGEIVILNENGWTIPESRSFVKSISQEHGIIQASEELLEKIKVGDLLGILPVHSCMTADCMKSYLSLDGKWVDHAESVH